jgi:hypothetical protein
MFRGGPILEPVAEPRTLRAGLLRLPDRFARLLLAMSDGNPDAVWDEAARDALIRAYVACRVATDALPDLPPEIRERVQDAVTELCDVIGPAVDTVAPEFFLRGRPGGADR